MDLTAVRVGGEVRLRWTTPSRTTDGRAIAGPVTAEVCRNPGAAAAQGCAVVLRVKVAPGASEAVDTLPAGLAAGAARVLAYRVQLKNAKGLTAGPSEAVYAAAGIAPGAIDGLRGRASKEGAVLEWAASGAAGDGVELRRMVVAGAAGGVDAKAKKPGLFTAAKEPAEMRLRVAEDAGGALDRTARIGENYRYAAARVRVVQVAGKTLELRGVESAAVLVEMVDRFPPEAPRGLVAAPGFGADGKTPAIDLSWEPGMEAGIAGYRVYRREGDGAWTRVGEMVAVPACRDETVAPGRRYRYRVTAVDAAGNESGPSGEVVETAPGQ